jgi:hypothetical protein
MQIMKKSSTGDEEQADAHAGLQRDEEGGEGVALEGGEGGAGVGHGVDADAEPGDAVAAEDAEHRGGEDDRDVAGGVVREHAEVVGHADRDEHPEHGEELALLPEVGLAGFPDDLGDVGHGLVDGQALGLEVLHPAVGDAEGADDEAEHQHVHAAEGAVEEAHGEGRGGGRSQGEEQRAESFPGGIF